MVHSNRRFRVFVSSTFSDLVEQRNALQDHVFPALRGLCMARGARFEAVDLRWGVSSEAGFDQRTVRICLEEIKRCQAGGLRPNFLILLGGRYGWRPLPEEIPEAVFDEVIKLGGESASALKELKHWYRSDRNALCPLRYLRPRYGEWREHGRWQELERGLLSTLDSAAHELSPGRTLTWGLSATELEIRAGAIEVPDARDHVRCFVRSIQHAPQIDSDAGAQTRLASLKARLRECLGAENCHEYSVGKVRAVLEQVLEADLRSLEHEDPLQREIAEHESFAAERGKCFVGREDIIDRILAYLGGPKGGPLVIWGESGSGKSALMARAVAEATSRFARDQMIVRFIGATPDSSHGRSLLESLCRELAVRYALDATRIPTEYRDLVGHFSRMLKLIPQDRPVVLFLDALDQLSGTDFAQNLAWLPEELPEGVRMVVSTAATPAIPLEVLESRYPDQPDNIVEVGRLPDSTAAAMLSALLDDAGRTLQASQQGRVMEGFERCALPLYLKLAFEEARLWRSHERIAQLPAAIQPLIESLFARLSKNANHGGLLVARSLGYLAAGRKGLTEDELLGILSDDTTVMSQVRRRSARHKVAEIAKGWPLPTVFWSRLYFDLKPYLTERAADGTAVLAFFHRQFGDAVDSSYLGDEQGIRRHRAIAKYMAAQNTVLCSGDRQALNTRKLSELPYQQEKARMWRQLKRTLCDIRFIESKCRAGLTYELIDDYNSSLANPGLPARMRPRIEQFARFVRAHSHVLNRQPELAFQLALNEPDSSAPWRAARQRLKAGKDSETRPHFRWINKPQSVNRCAMTLVAHRDIVNTCDVSPDGKWIASGSSDKQVRIWEAASGREVRALPHEASVEICLFSPDGRRILTGTREGAVRLWDAASYALLFHEQLHGDAVANGAFSRDGLRFATAAWDSRLVICDTETGHPFRNLAQESPVLSCDFAVGGKRILCGTNEGRLRVWDLESGEEGEGPEGHSGAIYRCLFSTDGSWILSCSQDGTLKRWDARTNELVATYTGHRGPVWTFDVSEEGKETRIISGSEDRTLILWDFPRAVPLDTFRDHAGAVWGVAWAPGGKTFVSAAWDWTVKLWSASAEPMGRTPADGAEQTAAAPPAGPAICCRASPDGRFLAAGSADGHVRVWNARTAALLADVAAHRDYTLVVAFSPDGRIVSGAFNGEVAIHDVAAPGDPIKLAGHERQRMLACRFSADGGRLLTCSVNRIRLWEMNASGARPIAAFDQREPGFSACALAPDASWAIAGDENGQLSLRGLPDGAMLCSIGNHAGLRHCSLSPDGSMLASASSDGTLKLWDVAGRRELASVRAHDDVVEACEFSADGRHVVSASWDATLKVWPVATLSAPKILQGHTDQLQDACFTADGTRVLSACMDTTVRLWDARTGAALGALMTPPDSVRACAFKADGQQIASASHRDCVKVWAAASGGVERVLRGHRGDVRACAFSPDGTRLITASADHTLKLWDTRRWQELRAYAGHEGPVESCSFSPDGERIASASRDGTVRVWPAGAEGRTLLVAPHNGWVRFVAWAGRSLVCCSFDAISIHRSDDGRLVATLRGHRDVIQAMAISGDSARLMTGSSDGEIRLWDIASGRELFAETAHAAAVDCCGFSHDGAFTFSGSKDGTLKLWRADPPGLAHTLSGHGGWVLAAAALPGDRLLLTGSQDCFLKAWEVDSGARVAEHWTGAPVQCVAVDRAARRIAAGDANGQVQVLELVNALSGRAGGPP